jgi:hypothetical protein
VYPFYISFWVLHFIHFYYISGLLLLLLLLFYWSHSDLAGFQRVRITEKAHLIYHSAKNFWTIRHALILLAAWHPCRRDR